MPLPPFAAASTLRAHALSRPATATMTRAARSVLVFTAAVALASLAITRDAWPWIADDAFISLRYGENLLAGHGLVWNVGERVEGYSNLLWILLTAGLQALGCAPLTAVRLLGVTCTAGTLAVLACSRLLPPAWPARLAVLTLAAQGSLALWTIAGLETPLAMLLLVLTMLGLERAFAGDAAPRPGWLAFAGVQLAALAWTRPDGPLWAAFAATTVWWCGRGVRRLPLLAALLAPPIVAVLLQLGFRLAYYDDWLPNTGRVKVAPLALCIDSGIDYLRSAGVALRSLLLPALLGASIGWRVPRARVPLLFATVGAVGWGLYVVRVGGDVFPRSRFLVLVMPALTVLAGHGFAALAVQGRTGQVAAWTLLLTSTGLARFDAERPTTDPWQQVTAWEWRAAAIGDWLGRAFAEQQPLVAVDAAGAVPYFSRLPSLDMLGLCDRTIARTEIAPERVFTVGHNRGNGRYVLSRRPDLVLFNVPGSVPVPTWQSGVEMFAEPAFFRDHRLVWFELGPTRLGDGSEADVTLLPWLRLEGRIGVTRIDGRIRIPGHLLGSFRQTAAPEDRSEATAWAQRGAVVGLFDAARGQVVGEVRRSGRITVPQVELPAGRWSVTADAPTGVSFGFATADGAELPRDGNVWRVDGPAGSLMVDVVCDVPAATPLPFRIAELVLQPAG